MIDFIQESFPTTGKAGSIIFVKGASCPLVIQPLSRAIYWWQVFDAQNKQARLAAPGGEKGSSRKFVFYGRKLNTTEIVPVVCGSTVWERVLGTMQSAAKLNHKSAYVTITSTGAGMETQYNVTIHSPAEPLEVPDTLKPLEEVRDSLLAPRTVKLVEESPY